MKRITFILLTALLISQTMAQGQILDIVGPLTQTAFGCLAEDGYQFAIVRAYSLDNGGSIDPNAIQTIMNSQNANIYTQTYMVICRNNDAASQVNTVISTLGSLYTYTWIKVQPNTVAGCQWPIDDPFGNCAFLVEAVNAFANNGKMPGIFSTANIWKSFFGNNCDNVFLELPLWYADYDTTGHVNSDPSGTDFVSFGGWVQPSILIKQIGGNVHVTSLCGNPTWHAFIDIEAYVSPPP